MAEDDRTALRARIHGRVQGVGYRAWVEREALALRLAGWVRNREDGTVEALFIGNRRPVETMLERCRKGPPLAKVERIETEPAQGIAPDRFEVMPTV